MHGAEFTGPKPWWSGCPGDLGGDRSPGHEAGHDNAAQANLVVRESASDKPRLQQPRPDIAFDFPSLQRRKRADGNSAPTVASVLLVQENEA